MKNRANAILALSVLSVLSACSSSPPMRYYTLSVAAPEASVTTQGGAVSAPLTPIQVGRVTIPGDIDRTQLVSRIDANRLKISDMDRWAAPLDEMIRRTLASDLAARLPSGAVFDLDDSRVGQKRRVLSLDIQEFHGGMDCSVTLRAAWMIVQPDLPGAQGTEEVRVPSSGACPDTLPAGMSQALAELSDRIASAIGRDAKLGAQ
jgi:uncharacterized lipoprotein YmbA